MTDGFLTAIAAISMALPEGPGSGYRKPDEVVADPETARRMLVEGNARFAENRPMPRTTIVEDRAVASRGQWPFAAIITCSDSRVAPELYFDRKMGDLFVIRNAGNIADSTALGSMEYAVEHLGVRLVVVVGHESCGAVNGAFGPPHGASANLRGILDRVRTNAPNSRNPEEAILENIRSVRDTLAANDAVRKTGTFVLGGFFHLDSGRVDFLDRA